MFFSYLRRESLLNYALFSAAVYQVFPFLVFILPPLIFFNASHFARFLAGFFHSD